MSKTKHGFYGTRLYHIFVNMKYRCNNPHSNSYKDYGGRGITVCEEWNTPEGVYAFFEWAYANGYKDDLTIDRIDVNKGYSPDNCRWVTLDEQARNKRNNHKVMFDGKEMCLSEVSRITNIKKTTLRERIKRSGELDISPTRQTYVDYEGRQVTLKELSKITGIGYSTLLNRLHKGYTGKEMYEGYLLRIKRPVVQFDKAGVELARFESVADASSKTGIGKTSIGLSCTGKRKTGGGFIWRYENEL